MLTIIGKKEQINGIKNAIDLNSDCRELLYGKDESIKFPWECTTCDLTCEECIEKRINFKVDEECRKLIIYGEKDELEIIKKMIDDSDFEICPQIHGITSRECSMTPCRMCEESCISYRENSGYQDMDALKGYSKIQQAKIFALKPLSFEALKSKIGEYVIVYDPDVNIFNVVNIYYLSIRYYLNTNTKRIVNASGNGVRDYNFDQYAWFQLPDLKSKSED